MSEDQPIKRCRFCSSPVVGLVLSLECAACRLRMFIMLDRHDPETFDCWSHLRSLLNNILLLKHRCR